MEKYFISNCHNYSTKNSLQKHGTQAIKWLDKILVDDLPKIEATLMTTIAILNKQYIRCKPMEVEFSLPRDGRAGYCGIKGLYTFYIYPVAKDYTEKEVSNG